MNGKKRSAFVWLSLLVAMCLLLSGCGSSGQPSTESVVDTESVAPSVSSESVEESADKGETILLRIYSGSTGGSWNTQASIVAKHLEGAMDNVRATVSPGNTLTNLAAVEEGDADIGIGYVSTTAGAINGEEAYGGKKYENVNHMISMAPLAATVFVRKDSDITSIEELKTKHVIPGDIGSIAEEYFRNIINMYGFTYDDIESSGGVVTYTSYADASQMLQDRNADATIVVSEHPYANILSLHAVAPVRLIGLREDVIQQLLQTYPGTIKLSIPGVGVYDTTEEEQVDTIGSLQSIYCRSDLNEEVVYQYCKAFYENIEEVAQSNANIAALTPESMLTGADSIPIHPGAQRFYDEWTDANK